MSFVLSIKFYKVLSIKFCIMLEKSVVEIHEVCEDYK